MARTNTRAHAQVITTHEGGTAVSHMTSEQELRRSVLASMLFENQFYENGEDIADRIVRVAKKVHVRQLAELAIETRLEHNLRHVSLLLVVALLQRASEWREDDYTISDVVAKVVSRADELTELLALYWKVNGEDASLSAQLKRGLAKAFVKFDAYQLAKYDRANKVKLRDVLRLVHPVPKDEAQAKMWGELKDGTLASPDTWEVALSGGADKRETFERLLDEHKLGYLALLRNLRNMDQSGVPSKKIEDAIVARKGGAEKVLPFRYTAAARAAPRFEKALDSALQAAITELPKLTGTTVVLVDVSGSMDYHLSGKSDLKCVDAAATLAAVINAEDLRVFSFSTRTVEVPARRGMAGVDAVIKSQPHGGTQLASAIRDVNAKVKYDRIIVITDEQSHDGVAAPLPGAKAYMINVASAKNGVSYQKNWKHLDGFSERVLHWIYEFEAQEGK